MSYTTYKLKIRFILPNPQYRKPIIKHRFFFLGTTFPFPERSQLVRKRRVVKVPSSNSMLHYIQQFSDVMTSMEIPDAVQSELLQNLASYATDEGFGYAKLFVKIIAITYVDDDLEDDDDDDIAQVGRESMEHGVKTIPANKESTDALERLVFDGLDSSMDCTVCMEEIKAGIEVIRMPCYHIYHSNCIVQWLQTSHFCPLCRYQMP